jgi:hypothetical protein
MKTCKVCALELEDSYLYCPDDGSNLGVSIMNSLDNASNPSKSDKDIGESTVLYCPACAAEYPLTFSSCPVHHVPLTRHHIPKLSNSSAERPEATFVGSSHAVASAGITEHNRGSELTSSVALQRPEIESSKALPHISSLPAVTEAAEDAVEDEPVVEWIESEAPPAGITTPLDWETRNQANKHDGPGFRLAAVATAIALGILAFIAVSRVIPNLSRRSTPTAQSASKTQVTPQPAPFVATPQEAQEYKEEPPSAPKKVEEPSLGPQEESPVVRQREQSRTEASSQTSRERTAHKAQTSQTVPRSPSPAPPVSSTSANRGSNPAPQAPALPNGNTGGFDARLIRVRSNRTSAGVRYDLTFNMQEQAGRMAQWQRVLISTHSASGIRHAEAIPFPHRLGPAAALTFTISVELNGRSEADWRGRVVCTTLGWDRQGAPLQASFGANVTP